MAPPAGWGLNGVEVARKLGALLPKEKEGVWAGEPKLKPPVLPELAAGAGVAAMGLAGCAPKLKEGLAAAVCEEEGFPKVGMGRPEEAAVEEVVAAGAGAAAFAAPPNEKPDVVPPVLDPNSDAPAAGAGAAAPEPNVGAAEAGGAVLEAPAPPNANGDAVPLTDGAAPPNVKGLPPAADGCACDPPVKDAPNKDAEAAGVVVVAEETAVAAAVFAEAPMPKPPKGFAGAASAVVELCPPKLKPPWVDCCGCCWGAPPNWKLAVLEEVAVGAAEVLVAAVVEAPPNWNVLVVRGLEVAAPAAVVAAPAPAPQPPNRDLAGVEVRVPAALEEGAAAGWLEESPPNRLIPAAAAGAAVVEATVAADDDVAVTAAAWPKTLPVLAPPPKTFVKVGTAGLLSGAAEEEAVGVATAPKIGLKPEACTVAEPNVAMPEVAAAGAAEAEDEAGAVLACGANVAEPRVAVGLTRPNRVAPARAPPEEEEGGCRG